jgi:hypothetical protein
MLSVTTAVTNCMSGHMPLTASSGNTFGGSVMPRYGETICGCLKHGSYEPTPHHTPSSKHHSRDSERANSEPFS